MSPNWASGALALIGPSLSGTSITPPRVYRCQTRIGLPVRSSIRSSRTSRLYCPQKAETLIALASASTQNVIPMDDGKMPSSDRHILVGRAVVHGVAAAFGQFIGDERRLFVFFLGGRV